MKTLRFAVLVLYVWVVPARGGWAAPGLQASEAPAPQEAHGTAEEEEKDEKEKKEKEKPKWDVSNPPGPMSEVAIDTDQGTWMNLDVSPQGDEIIFDLLGDLYRVAITGGEAQALTSGVAWDMQPRYSPDGRHIAFTSDRGGGDNIWIMRRDGSEPAAVTKESFRLLNSPAWSPDGQYIAARKHFTSQRSIGAGEIWLYHRAGGEGLQMTKRPNDQKELGEPAFSPDGRYVYFSQDITPGMFFEYNKDPNTELFVIQRLDRQTGEMGRFITGEGGSVRATPSPDGARLAFVRRVRTKSVLYVSDLKSGVHAPIFDGLDRDMQETWAIHGLYPTLAWTPDNRSIVFWAGGKIQRIDVASRQVTPIPFHVKSTRKIAEALRFPIAVAPQTFPVRMLRWVEVSPAGDQVIYQALGHLYIRDLPQGAPRRLTTQTDHFEFYPAFSRDGKWVVYSTWNDAALGSVRIVAAAGGEGRVITREPGHYAEPVFSPDGAQVVFRKLAGGLLRGQRWGQEPGIYWAPVTGGEAKRITKDAVEPQFGAAGDRIFVMTFEPEDKRALKSMDLDGGHERTHLLSEEATAYRLSPDEKWVAFTERFNAYIVPFARTGKTVDIGPDAKSLPVAKVSRDAGKYLHWSGDSTRLHWALGAELFTRDLKDAFRFLEGAPAELPKAPEKGAAIGWDAAADVPSGIVALLGARIITMRGDEVIASGAIVVEGNRIRAVGPRSQVQVPPGAKILDVSGHTILPGLVDVHWHGGQGDEEIVPQQNPWNYSSLAFGVTTIHDPSHDTSEIFAASEMARAGLIAGPRIYSTGTILYGAKLPIRAVIESLEDARSHLRRMKAVGAFSVKSYNQPRRDQRQQVVAAARELEMMVVPEGGSTLQHNLTMIADGHTGIEHSLPVARIYKDVVQLWAKSRVGYTPTLVVGYGGLWGENYWYQKTNVWENQRLLNFMPRARVDARARRRPMAPDDDFGHLLNARVVAELARAGVSVQLGAHGQREGLGAHWELWMLAQGGLTPLEALRAATLRGARYLGLDKDIGSLEPGKLADLVVLQKNPLTDIRNSESVRYTMVNGRIYDALTMNEAGNHPRPRDKFPWERDEEAAPPAAP